MPALLGPLELAFAATEVVSALAETVTVCPKCVSRERYVMDWDLLPPTTVTTDGCAVAVVDATELVLLDAASAYFICD